jgi:hypothetical protein
MKNLTLLFLLLPFMAMSQTKIEATSVQIKRYNEEEFSERHSIRAQWLFDGTKIYETLHSGIALLTILDTNEDIIDNHRCLFMNVYDHKKGQLYKYVLINGRERMLLIFMDESVLKFNLR